MLRDKTKEMINLYFDNEFPREKEPALFEALSNNKEAQEYFSNMHRLSRLISETDSPFPPSLEEKILRKIPEIKTGNKKDTMKKYFYAAAAVILIICGIFYGQMNSYKNELISLNRKISNQNETIMQLYNSLPAVVVTAEKKNEVVVKANL